MEQAIRKYPRTPHLEGSALQPGDEDLSQTRFADISGQHVVYEEKIDGANCGFFFDEGGNPHAQSRGHELDLTVRGGRERHFNLFKDWLAAHEGAFLARFGDRYIVYGEWTYVAHTVFYDALPHYFHEFDIWDKETGRFLTTPARFALLEGLPIISAPVLYAGPARDQRHLTGLIRDTLYKTDAWMAALQRQVILAGLDPARTTDKFEQSRLAEGIYVKIEDAVEVIGRLKYVRPGFTQKLTEVDEHWQSRPIVPNVLRPDVNIFAPILSEAAS